MADKRLVYGDTVAEEHAQKAWDHVVKEIKSGSDIAVPTLLHSNKDIVVIDAGHGLRIDPGAANHHGHLETHYTDPVALEMAKQLSAKGYEVVFTRAPGEKLPHDDYFNSLGKKGHSIISRGDYAAVLGKMTGAKSVTLLSLHVDSSTNASRSGAAVFVASEETPPNGKLDFKAIDDARNPVSEGLARKIGEHYDLTPASQTRLTSSDHGLVTTAERRFQRLGVNGSAAILELGFLSNKGDVKTLAETSPTAIAAKLTRAIDENIRDSYGSAQKHEPASVAQTPEPKPESKPAPQPKESLALDVYPAREIQQALFDAGYKTLGNTGSQRNGVDNDWGGKSIETAKSWQIANGIPTEKADGNLTATQFKREQAAASLKAAASAVPEASRPATSEAAAHPDTAKAPAKTENSVTLGVRGNLTRTAWKAAQELGLKDIDLSDAYRAALKAAKDAGIEDPDVVKADRQIECKREHFGLNT